MLSLFRVRKSTLVLKYSKDQPRRQSNAYWNTFCQSRWGKCKVTQPGGNAPECATEIQICMFNSLHSKCSKVGYKIVNTLLLPHPSSQGHFICNKEWWLSMLDDSLSYSKRLITVTLFALSFSHLEETPISKKKKKTSLCTLPLKIGRSENNLCVGLKKHWSYEAVHMPWGTVLSRLKVRDSQ